MTQHLGSTLGLFGTYIAFDWRGLFAEQGDLLNLLWSNDGSTFNALASYDLTNNAYTRAVVPIPDNQADLFIRFQLSVDDTEVANVDNVEVGVPEPSTLGLIGLGLLGLGAMRRRRRMRKIYLTVVAAWPAFASPCTHAAVLYDNGPVIESATDLLFNNTDPDQLAWSVYDDFVLSSNSVISGFRWNQFDQPTTEYDHTLLAVFDGVPTPSSLVALFDVIADRSPNGLTLATGNLPLPPGTIYGFDYLLDGLSLSLAAGTYFLGIQNITSPGYTLIANAAGAPSSIPGFYQHTLGGPILFGLGPTGPSEYHNGNMAFRVNGDPVPEPTTLSLIGLGLLGLGAMRRRRRNGSVAKP